MLNSVVFNRTVKALGLTAVVPILIGHGANVSGGCVLNNSACDAPDPYIVSGSESPDSNVVIGDNLSIQSLGVSYESPSESSKSSVPPIIIAPNYLPPNKEIFSVQVNGPLYNASSAEVGALWLHDGKERKIKLIHPGVQPSFIRMEFDTEAYGGFTDEQTSSVASSSMYMLSGGSDDSMYFDIEASVEVFLNDISIYTKEQTVPESLQAPILFEAMTGDELRIFAKNVDSSSTKVSPLWLFLPNGEGIKLFHGGESGVVFGDESIFLDMRYVVP